MNSNEANVLLTQLIKGQLAVIHKPKEENNLYSIVGQIKHSDDIG